MSVSPGSSVMYCYFDDVLEYHVVEVIDPNPVKLGSWGPWKSRWAEVWADQRQYNQE